MTVAAASNPVQAVEAGAQSRDRGAARGRSTFARRLIALCVFVCCAAVLGVAMWLTPSPTGIGTHRVMGLPPCTWVAWGDIPCPTCGMTTSFAHAVRGDLGSSFRAQPLGFLLALATAMTMLVSLHVVITGSRLGWAFTKLWSRRTAWTLSIIVVAAWGFKVLSYKGWL